MIEPIRLTTAGFNNEWRICQKINELVDYANKSHPLCCLCKPFKYSGAVGGEKYVCEYCHDDYKCPEHDKPKDKPVEDSPWYTGKRRGEEMKKGEPSEGLEEILEYEINHLITCVESTCTGKWREIGKGEFKVLHNHFAQEIRKWMAERIEELKYSKNQDGEKWVALTDVKKSLGVE